MIINRIIVSVFSITLFAACFAMKENTALKKSPENSKIRRTIAGSHVDGRQPDNANAVEDDLFHGLV